MKLLVSISLSLICQITYSQTWSALGNGIYGNGWAMTVHNSMVFVGGDFDSAGSVICNKMAYWDGTTWNTPPGVPGGDNISALESFNGNLYMSRGNPPSIHEWDNNTWSGMGSGLNSVAVDMIGFNSELYVGGLFITAGGLPAKKIAKWDGSSWSAVGGGFDREVLSLEVYNNQLYAGGRFDTLYPSFIGHRIARFNGSSWLPVGGGITGGTVYAMTVYNGELWVGGNFQMAGGIPCDGLARWNGSSWAAVPGTTNGFGVSSLRVYNNELYVGGSFTSIAGISANSLAKFDGTNWSAVGQGTAGFIDVMEVLNGDLYVSGTFTDIGGISANNIARYSVPVGIPDNDVNLNLSIYPNPATHQIRVDLKHKPQYALLKIYDLLGNTVKVITTSGNDSFRFNISDLDTGLYTIELTDNKSTCHGKFIKRHE